MTPRKNRKQTVYLTGEAELVREFGAVCLRAGLTVASPPSPRGAGVSLPAGFRRTTAIPPGTAAAVELTNTDTDRKKSNLVRLDRSLPRGVPVISTSVTVTVGTQATWLRHAERLVGFGGFPTLMDGPLAEVAVSPATGEGALTRARDIFATLGKDICVVQDRAGLVMPRILCSIINEACFALTEEVATPQDIDTAMKLGTAYPRGPLEWAALAGIGQVVAVLDAVRAETGEERYRVAPLLRQMVLFPGLLK